MTPGSTCRRRRVRLIVVRAFLLLLLGATVNVAVAWGLVTWPIRAQTDSSVTVSEVTRWWDSQRADNARLNYFVPTRCVGVSTVQVHGYIPPTQGASGSLFANQVTQGYAEAGWPMRALSSEWHGIIVSLPQRPIWPGFAINTLFYATILWLLIAFPFTLRRWRRVRRGLCVKCAYPVGASDVCTECGAAVRARPTAS